MDILSNVGMSVKSEKALKMLHEAGAAVDFGKGIARIPSHLLGEVLKWAPPSIAIWDRDRVTSLDHGGDNTYAWSGNDANYVLTSEMGERRIATVEDVGRFARLADALENIHVVGVEGTPQDVPRGYAEVKAAEVMLNSSSKHLFFCPSTTGVARAQLKLAQTITGEDEFAKRPIITFLVCPTTPLSWGKWAVETLIEGSRNGVPCIVNSCPTTGGTAPISLAGTLVLQNAENLSGVLVSQLARKGAPAFYGSTSLALDMHESTTLIGTPETAALRVATTQLGKSNNLPTMVNGPDSQSHCLDEQNAWEKIMTGAAAINSRVNILMNPGMFASGLTVSYEQLVIDNEMLGWLFRLQRGIEVSEETLAVKQIEKAGPEGQLLGKALEFALKRLKAEYWTPGISCRYSYNKWVDRGRKSIVKIAREKAEEILRVHQPKKLDDETKTNLGRIVDEFERSTGL